jgi:hypothetical protein
MLIKIFFLKTVMRIRIGSGFNRVPGSRRTKIPHKKNVVGHQNPGSGFNESRSATLLKGMYGEES